MAGKKETDLAKKSAAPTALAPKFDYGEMAGDGWAKVYFISADAG